MKSDWRICWQMQIRPRLFPAGWFALGLAAGIFLATAFLPHRIPAWGELEAWAHLRVAMCVFGAIGLFCIAIYREDYLDHARRHHKPGGSFLSWGGDLTDGDDFAVRSERTGPTRSTAIHCQQ